MNNATKETGDKCIVEITLTSVDPMENLNKGMQKLNIQKSDEEIAQENGITLNWLQITIQLKIIRKYS